MLREMSEATFQDWLDYSHVHPFGQDVQDYRFARMMAHAAALQGCKGEAVDPRNYMLSAYREDVPAHDETVLTVSQAFRLAAGIV